VVLGDFLIRLLFCFLGIPETLKMLGDDFHRLN